MINVLLLQKQIIFSENEKSIVNNLLLIIVIQNVFNDLIIFRLDFTQI